MIKRSGITLLLMALLPAGVMAQELAVDRLEDVLPEDIFAQVMEQLDNAQARGLSGEVLANLALEGVTKGRSGEDVLAAVQARLADLGEAQDAIQAAGRAPEAGEVEAAAAAMSMGVNGSYVSDMARQEDIRGPELAAAILTMAGLTQQGVPAAEALSLVLQRLEEAGGDVSAMNELGSGMGEGGMPVQLGTHLANLMAPIQVPVGGVNVPLGPPSDVPSRRPGDLPGGPGGVPGGPGDVPDPPSGPGG